MDAKLDVSFYFDILIKNCVTYLLTTAQWNKTYTNHFLPILQEWVVGYGTANKTKLQKLKWKEIIMLKTMEISVKSHKLEKPIKSAQGKSSTYESYSKH